MIRLLLTCATGALISLATTWLLFRWMSAREMHQPIQEDGVPDHRERKSKTPTLGGIGVISGLAVGYVASGAADMSLSAEGLLLVGLAGTCCGIGLLDDWDKVSTGSNAGISASLKIRLQLAAATVFAVVAMWLTDVDTIVGAPSGRWSFDLGPIGWSVWAVLTIVAMSNGTNLTDGLDGLAGGSLLIAFSAIATMGFWTFSNPGLYGLDFALDLSVLAAGGVGAIGGFLWWNAPPAQIIMGDTGSLPLGALLAGLALLLNVDVLLPLLGALYVVETLSVMIQVGVFKRTGRRVFRMAPIHHHFEMAGWPETRIVVRFLLLAAFAGALAVGLFYFDYVDATTGVL